MEYVIGIDLGTTNSCVALVEDGKPRVLASKGGFRVLPSVVSIGEGGRRLVGHLARRQAITNPSNTIFAAKRLIGRAWDAPATRAAARLLPYDLTQGPHGDVRIRVAGQVLSVPEVSAYILQELRLIAEQHVGAPVERAVITVPAHFNDHQRQATKDAGRIAGLEVLRIINEPTAAALAHGLGEPKERKVAVYDLGGGTFDVSILDLHDGVFEVVGTAGDSYLGGADFDQRIIDYLLACFSDRHDLEIADDRLALQRLRDAAEQARCDLSTVESVKIDLPFLHTTATGAVYHLREELTRRQLEDLTADLVEKTIAICERTLAEARLTKAAIDEVVLVGGVTRMPLIQRRVAESFGREPCQGVNPDEVVALGAALQAAALVDDTQDLLLLDVTSHSLGIMLAGGRTHRLIDKNTTVPTKARHVYTTTRDNQTSVKIVVLQGEGDAAADNELLGEFMLSGLRKAPRGQVQVEITFAISVDGIVSVSAKDLETGAQQSITVDAQSGLGDDELARLIAESHAHMLEVRASEALSRQRRQIERLLVAVRSLAARADEVMTATRFGREALDRVEALIERGHREVGDREGRDLADLGEALERAQAMLQGVVERRGAHA